MHLQGNSELEKIGQASRYLQERVDQAPEIGLILGSGLSETLSSLANERSFSFDEVPNFPTVTVKGHVGGLLFGRLEDRYILVQRGRVHYYEGYSMHEVVFPVRVMKLLGVRRLITTNAAGAINESFNVGDLVLIKDHINMIPDSPLRGGAIAELGPRFPNLNDAYSKGLREAAIRAAIKESIELKQGVYIATPGPMYETPAEIQAYKILGADLVGMSTVPEVIAAAQCGMEVLGVSCVTNIAAGIGHSKLTYEEVLEVTAERGKDLIKLIRAILWEI